MAIKLNLIESKIKLKVDSGTDMVAGGTDPTPHTPELGITVVAQGKLIQICMQSYQNSNRNFLSSNYFGVMIYYPSLQNN